MKVVALLLCCVLVAQANVLKTEVQREWEKFMTTHKRTYNSEEENGFRFKIFRENLMRIIAHNKKYEQGKTTYKMAINRFTDMLPSEVIEKMTGALKGNNKRQGTPFVKSIEGDAPESMDWREKGAVTPVKDQAQCGSCWAFSATGSLEGQQFLKKGELVSLSEQNLMDCSWDYGNNGCGGGWMDQGFQYIVDNKGVDTEESYAYEGKDGECRFNADTVGATASGFVDLPVGDEDALKEALATVGPVSVAINANDGFMSYSGGVFKDESCDPQGLNHGVLAVGYGTEDGQDYWLVKNSWGASWGEEGYIKMARNFNNMCGITQAASYPKL